MHTYKIYRILILLVLFCTIWGNKINGQSVQKSIITEESTMPIVATDKLSFSHLTAADGFAGNAIFHSLQDQKGYMWFGTWKGLYKYDGLNLTLIQPNTEENPLKVVMSLLEDEQHRIWAMTAKGLVIWNAITEQIDTLDFSHLPNHSRSKKLIFSFCKGTNHSIWMGGAGLLCQYDQQLDKITDFSYLLHDTKSKIQTIYLDKTNQLWILTDSDGIFKLQVPNKDSQSKEASQDYRLVREPLFAFLNHKVNVLFQDTKYNYWVADDKNLYCLKHIFKPQQTWECIQFKDETQTVLGGELTVKSILQRKNTVFAATLNGLFSYNLGAKKAKFQTSNKNLPNKLNANNLYHIYVDNEDGLWIATFSGGVNYSSPTSNNFSLRSSVNQQINQEVVKSLVEDKSHTIWIGTEEAGLYSWNREKDQVTHYWRNQHAKFNLDNRNITSLATINHHLIIGSFSQGIDVIDLHTYKRATLTTKNTHPDPLPNNIYSLVVKDQETLWVGTQFGLYLLNYATGESHHINYIKGRVTSMVTDRYDNIWTSCKNDALYRYNKEKQNCSLIINFKNQNSAFNTCTTLATDDDFLYIGTNQEGLWRYRISTNKIEEIKKKEFAGKIIEAIVTDGEIVWVATQKGLLAYNKYNQSVETYTDKDGLCSSFFKQNTGFITSDKSILFGTSNGISCFKTYQIKQINTQPKAIITQLSIMNHPLEIGGKDSPLVNAIPYTKEITLSEGMHNIEFTLASSSYNRPEKNQFQYQMDPYDTNWITAKNNLALYTSLPAGNYTLRVRTSNREGLWSKEECIAVHVTPYWWKSSPMIITYILAIVGLFLFIFRRYQLKKQSEIQMIRYQKEIEIFQTKMDFFTYMVHELRTPLTLIVGPLSNIMKKEKSIKEIRPELEVMQRNSQRLLTLTNQLMDFRKIEEKSYNIRLGYTNLKELTQQLVSNFLYLNATKEIQVTQNYPDEEIWAYIDREAFTKVLTNLLSNAYKFTKDSIEVSIALSDDTKHWRVHVKDNGNGIPLNEQKSIFDSFYQVSENRPADYIGSGIGLFVVRRLLELQGGNIHVISQPGQGACFIAEIPVSNWETNKPTNNSNEIGETVSEERDSMLEETTNEVRLLIVEDNTDMCNYIASIFSANYPTDVCYDGVTALKMVTKKRYSLIITDLMMPGMDGITLCKTLKSQLISSHIPVVMLTAKADEESQVAGYGAEADGYVIKPFVAEVLLSQVQSIIANRELLRNKFYKEPKTKSEILCTNSTDKLFISKINKYISSHLSEQNIEVDTLAQEMGLGRTMFYQKVKQVTGLTPNDYIRTYRLKKAVSLMESGETRINEICYSVGFSSPSYFSKRFILQFGCSPSDYIKMHNR